MVDNRLLFERRSNSTALINYFIYILYLDSGWRNDLVDIQCSKGTVYLFHPKFFRAWPRIWPGFDPDSIQIWPISVQIWPDKMCMPSKWKKCYRLIQYLPIESASNFIRDNSVSDLHLILAMVELNGCRQKVKTISSKKVIIYTWYVRRKFDLNKHRFVEVNVKIRVRRTNKSAKLSQKAILQWF